MKPREMTVEELLAEQKKYERRAVIASRIGVIAVILAVIAFGLDFLLHTMRSHP
jgi:hypothetical protein